MSKENVASITDLIKGHKDFRQKYYQNNSALFRQLAKNQAEPKYLMIACADSQVDPTLITNCSPTDIYLVKNLGSFVPPFEEDVAPDLSILSAIEFALTKFDIQHVIILGHRHCQSVKALVEDDVYSNDNEYINHWLEHYQGAKDEIADSHMNLNLDEQRDICEKLCLLISLKNLSSYPIVQEKLSAGKLFIHTWYFDVDQGMLQYFNDQTAEFEKLEDALNDDEQDMVLAYRQEIMDDAVEVDANQAES